MAEPLAVTLLKRLRKSLEKVALPEDDDLGVLEINLKHLRDVVHPATEESVTSLLAAGATECAGHVMQHHLSIAQRVLGAETLSHPAMSQVHQLIGELATESEAMTGSNLPPTPDRPTIQSQGRPTMTDVLSAFFQRGCGNDLPATMATESRS